VATRHGDDVDLEPLTPIDLDDTEVGIRPEDRYASIPPGNRLIRRRVHQESSWAPLWLLLGLAVLFTLGALLGRSGSNDPLPGAPPDSLPALPVVTGDRVLVVGGSGAARYAVDDRTITEIRADGLPNGAVTAAAATEDGVVVVVDDERAYSISSGLPALDLGPAVQVAGDGNRAWLVVAGPDGLVAREADVGAAPAPEMSLPAGALRVGAVVVGPVVERQEPHRVEVLIADGPTQVVRRGHVLLATAGATVATRPAVCSAEGCDLVLTDVRHDNERVLEGALPANATSAAFSTDRGWLFVQDGPDLVAIDTTTGERYAAGRLPAGYPVLSG
jgi:hypothetical protein